MPSTTTIASLGTCLLHCSSSFISLITSARVACLNIYNSSPRSFQSRSFNMPVMRSLLVFLPAAAMTLMISTPFAVQHALAKPISMPSSPKAFDGFANIAARTDRLSTPKHLASHTTAIQAKSPKAPSRITAGHTERKAARSVPHVPREPSAASAHGSSNASSGKLARLQRYHRQALQHAANYRTLVK